MNYREHLAELKKDQEFAEEYNKLGMEYEIIERAIRERVERGITQKQVYVSINDVRGVGLVAGEFIFIAFKDTGVKEADT